MSEEFVGLRNRVNRNAFRFEMPQTLWEFNYASEKGFREKRVFTVKENGNLKGYAILQEESLGATDIVKVCRVLEIIADDEKTFRALIDNIIEQSLKDEVDFVLYRESSEKFDNVLKAKHFFSLQESAVMVILLNPKEFLSSISEKVEHGKILKFNIKGFGSILVKIGKKTIEVVTEGEPNLVVSTDNRTFLKLLFGKSSFLGEFLKRRVRVQGVLKLPTALRFIDIMKLKEWYLPSGDWL